MTLVPRDDCPSSSSYTSVSVSIIKYLQSEYRLSEVPMKRGMAQLFASKAHLLRCSSDVARVSGGIQELKQSQSVRFLDHRQTHPLP
jgi:hypothetical protein